jgi:hypothetical protein
MSMDPVCSLSKAPSDSFEVSRNDGMFAVAAGAFATTATTTTTTMPIEVPSSHDDALEICGVVVQGLLWLLL